MIISFWSMKSANQSHRLLCSVFFFWLVAASCCSAFGSVLHARNKEYKWPLANLYLNRSLTCKFGQNRDVLRINIWSCFQMKNQQMGLKKNSFLVIFKGWDDTSWPVLMDLVECWMLRWTNVGRCKPSLHRRSRVASSLFAANVTEVGCNWRTSWSAN